jgi:hypothetical protein
MKGGGVRGRSGGRRRYGKKEIQVGRRRDRCDGVRAHLLLNLQSCGGPRPLSAHRVAAGSPLVRCRPQGSYRSASATARRWRTSSRPLVRHARTHHTRKAAVHDNLQSCISDPQDKKLCSSPLAPANYFKFTCGLLNRQLALSPFPSLCLVPVRKGI